MKKLLLLLLSLVSIQSYAASGPVGTLGFTNFYQFGPKVVNLAPNGTVFILYGAIGGTGTTQNTTFRTANGTAGYAVTAGKTATCHGAYISSMSSGSSNIVLGYANNDVGQMTNTAFTTPIYLSGGTGGQFYQTNTAVSVPGIAIPMDFTIPATKLPFMMGAGSANGTVQLFCTES